MVSPPEFPRKILTMQKQKLDMIEMLKGDAEGLPLNLVW